MIHRFAGITQIAVKQGRPLNIALPLLLIATVFGAEEIQDKIKQAERAVAEGRFDQAINLYSEVLAAEPKNSSAYSARATAYLQKGDDEHALKDLTEAIGVNPKSANAYFAR